MDYRPNTIYDYPPHNHTMRIDKEYIMGMDYGFSMDRNMIKQQEILDRWYKIKKPKKKKNMKELTEGQRKNLTSDDQELVSAGFVCDRLDLVEEGRNALLDLLFEEKKVELAEIARKRNQRDERANRVEKVTHCC